MEKKCTPKYWDAIALPGGHNWAIAHQQTGIHIANVGDYHLKVDRGVLAGAQIEANANLIAASPELLKALEDIINSPEAYVLQQPFIDAAKSAIKKAYGEQ